jgi:hypothetical protein
MPARIEFAALMLLGSFCVSVKADTGPDTDVNAIGQLIARYVQAVNTVDLSLLSQIWSHSVEVSFIYPLGEEHGVDAIQQHVFHDVMGGMFSERDLQTHSVMVYVNSNAAWSEFHLDVSRNDAQRRIGRDDARRGNPDLP